ncbi:putative ribosomal export protein Nmd3 [Helianthus anomalus]
MSIPRSLLKSMLIGGSKYVMADAKVAARVSDFGKNDTMLFVRTHLGHLLSALLVMI